MNGHDILVIDDEPDIRELVRDILKDEGYGVSVAGNVAETRAQLKHARPDLILLDVWLPDGDGIGLLKEWKETGGLPCPVVMISGHGTVENAVEATRLGAYDFIEKPLSMAKLLLTVARAVEADQLAHDNLGLRRLTMRVVYPEGSSTTMHSLREQARRIARHDTWVLITGEPGSGKQTFARFLHGQSRRRDHPFIEVAVATLADEEAAAELLGRSNGERGRHSLLEQAHGGVLFLDEIGDMDLQTQGRLFSVLESRGTTLSGRPARGGALDVRVIAATQHDLTAEVAAGRFREDLYYRLSVVPLHIPPLREHLDDLPELIAYYLNFFHEQEGLPVKTCGPAALERLHNHDWPGNIRELRNLIQRLLILGFADEISLSEVDAALGNSGTPKPVPADDSISYDLPLREAREQFERQYLLHQIERVDGNITRLAEQTGIERTHLYRKLKALGIDPRNARGENT